MFGMNEKVGRNYFKDRAEDELLVTSRFYTLQGEGPYRGFPAYFVRLAKCNLNCSFCDTFFDSGDIKTFQEILDESDKVIADFYRKRDMQVPIWAEGKNKKIVLVITGGEPSLQTNLTAFLKAAKKHFYKTQIESNGIQHIDIPGTTYVVSPKCLEINGVSTKYLKPNKKVLEDADCLKFVMSAPESEAYTPYSEVPDWALQWMHETGKDIFVSPMNIYLKEPQKAKEMRALKGELNIEERSNVEEIISFWEPGLLDLEKNQRNHEYTAEYAMKTGCILNLQMHLFASLP